MLTSSDTDLSPAEFADMIAACRRATSLEERMMLEEPLVAHYLPLADRIAHKYVGRGADRDDLEAVARLALLRAIRRFEPERGAFEAYAVVTISGEIKKFFRDYCWTVRPTRRVQELQQRLAQVEERHHQTRQPVTIAAMAAEAGVERADAAEALSLRGLFSPQSIEAPSDSGHTLQDRLADPEDHFGQTDDLLALGRSCADLTDADRDLIRMRFFEDMSQQQIADVLGVSQMQVSRRLRKLLDTLREALMDHAA